ncbi:MULTISPECIES: macro domain-containing protein [unclassified Pseudarthrobacter]|uniref:macro domain-containing protein n=1 Tax=unclassified Pseudarthrobacter TaxID=2647000 RepID=UPI0030787E2C
MGLLDIFFKDVFDKLGAVGPVGIVAVAFAWGVLRAWPRPIEQKFTTPNTEVRIVEGDLFDQPENIVVGMASTFDTAIPDIIQTNSVQGQLLTRVFRGDVAKLDAELASALVGVLPIDEIQKPGKTDVYPWGTVARIRVGPSCYFCFAYTQMNEHNEARTTVGGLWSALENLWDQVRIHGNGAEVSIPVIGGGQARISQQLPAQDSIRFIAMSFVLASRKEKVCDRLNIVVRPQDAPDIDMLEIQAFLKSLRMS